MNLNLAIYTADHGLGWKYNPACIGFAELDACRTAFGSLPDFDAGEPGFDGVIVGATRVFVIRCSCAPKWDFLGRDAVYLAVAWFPRSAFPRIDVQRLLACDELCVPQKEPVLAFEFEESPDVSCPVPDAEGCYRRRRGDVVFERYEKVAPVGAPSPAAPESADAIAVPRDPGARPRATGPLWGSALLALVLLAGLVLWDYWLKRKEVSDDTGGEVSQSPSERTATVTGSADDAGGGDSQGTTEEARGDGDPSESSPVGVEH